MTPDELDSWLERTRTESASMVAPDAFTDRVMRQVRHHEPPAPRRFELLSGAVSSGALVAAGIAIWMSLGDRPLDPSSLPVAMVGVAVAMGGLAWMWFDDPLTSHFTFRLSELRPY
jgi:hypothetical protein